MAIGETLKKAREAKGLTTAELANELHLKTQIVEDLEHDDFHNITASIYGRGFIKLCAERLGLDPAPLLAEFATAYQKPSHETAPYGTAEYRRQEELARARVANAASRPPRHPIPIRPAEATEITPRPVAASDPVAPSVTVTPGIPVAPHPADAAEQLFLSPAVAPPPPSSSASTAPARETPAPEPAAAETARLFGSPSASGPTPAARPAATETPLPDIAEDTLFPTATRRSKTVSVDPPRDGQRPRTGRFVPPSRQQSTKEEPTDAAPEPPKGPGPLRRAAHAVGGAATRSGRAIGRAASATGCFFSRHVRVTVFSIAAVLMTLLAVWAVLGIRDTLKARHDRKVAARQAAPAVQVDLLFPPPAMYAD